MKSCIVVAGLLSLALSSGSHAAALLDYPEWQYANVLQEGAFTCGLKSSNMQAAISRGSADQARLRADYMKCISEWSAKAQSGLGPAVKVAKSESVKSAVKDLYGAWDAYFGVLRPGAAKAQYEMARGKLKAELLSN